MSVSLQNGKLRILNDDGIASIDDLVKSREALYDVLANQSDESLSPNTMYYLIKLLKMTEPTYEQWERALSETGS